MHLSWEMAKRYANDIRVRFFIGDVRDSDRLGRAPTVSTVSFMTRCADVILTAAGYNLRIVLAWLRSLLRLILPATPTINASFSRGN